MTLLVLCVAALALISSGVSAALAAALAAFRARIDALAPSAQARLLFAASVAPLAIAILILTAALAPSFGWISDHCYGSDPHAHAHICGHHVAAWPSLFLIGIASLVTARAAWFVASHVYALVRAAFVRRALDAASREAPETGARVLPFAEPQAFVLGLFRPRLYVTEGLARSEHLGAVLAHERAHVARHDPLRRFVAGLGLAFHLPGVARTLGAALARTQEMAADDHAARSLASRVRVARALVALARARAPATALAFSGSDVPTRVAALMDDRPRSDRPTPVAFAVVALAAIVGAASSAELIHHGVEMLLGVFGS